jgi:hypothetical protein
MNKKKFFHSYENMIFLIMQAKNIKNNMFLLFVFLSFFLSFGTQTKLGIGGRRNKITLLQERKVPTSTYQVYEF